MNIVFFPINNSVVHAEEKEQSEEKEHDTSDQKKLADAANEAALGTKAHSKQHGASLMRAAVYGYAIIYSVAVYSGKVVAYTLFFEF